MFGWAELKFPSSTPCSSQAIRDAQLCTGVPCTSRFGRISPFPPQYLPFCTRKAVPELDCRISLAKPWGRFWSGWSVQEHGVGEPFKTRRLELEGNGRTLTPTVSLLWPRPSQPFSANIITALINTEGHIQKDQAICPQVT